MINRLKILILIVGCIAAYALDPSDVLVVANTKVKGSLEVAQKFIKKYNLKSDQLLKLELVNDAVVSQQYYLSQIEKPIVTKAINQKSKVVVLCYGMPWRVIDAGPSPRQDGAKSRWTSVDSALAMPGTSRTKGYKGCQNPYFNSKRPFERQDMLLVGRIDGPSLAIALDLLEVAPKSKKSYALIDMQPSVNKNTLYGIDVFNNALEQSASILAQKGYETFLDNKQSLAPKIGQPLKYYWGWYAGPNGDYNTNTFKKFKWQPGAIAIHTCSFGARDIRNAKHAVGGLLSDGVKATIGTANEPYVSGWTRPNIFFDTYLNHKLSFIESAYTATPYLSWQSIMIGDPLMVNGE